MATSVNHALGGTQGGNIRYYGVATDLANLDTIGITVDGETFLHTVGVGGQNLADALEALAVLVEASVTLPYNASVAQNAPFDHTLRIKNAAGAPIALTLPVYAVA
jgi:hypothetical protein